MPVLKEDWKPTLTLNTVMFALQLLFVCRTFLLQDQSQLCVWDV